jgi:hypothetical protein
MRLLAALPIELMLVVFGRPFLGGLPDKGKPLLDLADKLLR